MRPIGSSRTIPRKRPIWEPPAMTKIAIAAATRSPGTNDRNATLERPGSAQPTLAHLEPPENPATKLGFSLEMAFPLSARTEH